MKVVTANKINRLWNNGIMAKLVAKTKVLNTAEEIEANTSAENVTGALVAKELYNNLKGFEPILDSTGKITGYKTSVGGADTVFPFISGIKAVFSGSGINIPNLILPNDGSTQFVNTGGKTPVSSTLLLDVKDYKRLSFDYSVGGSLVNGNTGNYHYLKVSGASKTYLNQLGAASSSNKIIDVTNENVIKFQMYNSHMYDYYNNSAISNIILE